jgi:hypothetical protein
MQTIDHDLKRCKQELNFFGREKFTGLISLW